MNTDVAPTMPGILIGSYGMKGTWTKSQRRETRFPGHGARTATGVVLPSLVPSPSWPSKLLPQQSVAPPLIRAQVSFPPAATAVAPLTPETETGVDPPVVVPLPSSPSSLAPQHSTVPPLKRAQA